jgi:uncharacterized protein (DUF58 family)
MPHPTGRGCALLGLAAVTYLAGRLVGTWELYLLAFAFLAAVIVSWLLVFANGRRVHVTRTLSTERPVAGDEPEFIFSVKNASLLPGPQLTLRSPLAGLSTGDLELEIESLSPRTQILLKRHAGLINRGVHILPAVEAVAEDPIGITGAVRKVTEPLVVTVLPRIASLESCALYPDAGLKHDWSGRYGLRSIGASEFKGVRPHQPGEPLSHIDWKSTAKTGVLMLREMEEPAGADITMLLDGTAAEVLGEPPDSNFELAVRAAGSIADFVLRSGRGVSLICHERNMCERRLTADGSGRRALLQALAETQPNASVPLVGALRHLRTDGPHLLRTQSVAVVSISLDRNLACSLVQLKEDGVQLALLHVVGASFVRGKTESGFGAGSTLLPFPPPSDTGSATDRPDAIAQAASSASADAEAGLSTEARALLLSLSSAGIPCVTLSRGDDLVRQLSLWRAGHHGATVAR